MRPRSYRIGLVHIKLQLIIVKGVFRLLGNSTGGNVECGSAFRTADRLAGHIKAEANWVSRLQGGADETAIVLSFLLSAEELSAPNNVFVQRLYQGALGRSASDGEVNYWVGQLTQEGLARGSKLMIDTSAPDYLQNRGHISKRIKSVRNITNRGAGR